VKIWPEAVIGLYGNGTNVGAYLAKVVLTEMEPPYLPLDLQELLVSSIGRYRTNALSTNS
jgi:hypothetical protein